MMEEKTTADENEASVGFDRMNAAFAWWGPSGADSTGMLDGQLKHFQLFTSDLQKACGEKCGAQMSALVSANERIWRSGIRRVPATAGRDRSGVKRPGGRPGRYNSTDENMAQTLTESAGTLHDHDARDGRGNSVIN